MSFEEHLLQFKSEKNWKNILKLAGTLKFDEKCKYLWAWPTEENLKFFKNMFNKLNIKSLLSIGCGSGLLEWIIMEYTGIPVFGIERDKDWWRSKYSPDCFIDLNYIDDIESINQKYLQDCCCKSNNFTLCFCYFNSNSTFKNYLDCYEGKNLIIIGPGKDKKTYTEPLPFDLGLGESNEWNLYESCEISNTKDFIAIYTRI